MTNCKITRSTWEATYKPVAKLDIDNAVVPYVKDQYIWSNVGGYLMPGNLFGASYYYVCRVSHDNKEIAVIPVCRCGADTEDMICPCCQSTERL